VAKLAHRLTVTIERVQFTDCDVRLAAGRSVRIRFATPSESNDPLVQAVANGSWQPTDALRWLLLNIAPGNRVLDLGAHVGTFALLAAALGANVTAVEASPGNAELLEAATQANSASDRVTIIQAAVTREIGKVSFADQGPYGTIDTERTGGASGWPVITASATTIDALSTTPFHWVKLDIEGAECDAIAGGRNTLGLAQGLAVESNGYMLGQHGTTVGKLLRSLRSLGYSPYTAVGQILSPLGRRAFQPETTLDYVAVTGGSGPALPAAWELGRVRRRSDLLIALVQELSHPVPQHRAYALSVARAAPLWAPLPLPPPCRPSPRCGS
jgi:FkbM family methyltransferase